MPPCYSPDALGVVSEMPEYSVREALLWQLIAKNRKRRVALHTALRTYQRRQLLLRVACLTALLLAVFQTRIANFNIFELNRSCYFCLVLQKNF